MKQFIIDETLVRHLVSTQFPQWKDLAVCQVPFGGWDNRTFRLGEDMLVRLPSAEAYAVQVEKEQQWLPRLAPFLPLPIPEPLALGARTEIYPWQWSIYRWLEGEPASTAYTADVCDFANSLAEFLRALQQIDTSGGPSPGSHNFYRGGLLKTYDAETRQAIEILKETIDSDVASEIWETALQTTWQGSQCGFTVVKGRNVGASLMK